MQSQDILNWYEEGLPQQERKVRGHFSTPPLLVEYILDACGYTANNDLSRLRVLDPACGSGNFLAGAALRLLKSGQRLGLSHQEQIQVVQHNIWGFDPDPISCFLAEMQVHTVLAEESKQCYVETCRSCKHKQTAPLHVHQADGLAFPWKQDADIDLFLANPPYLAAKNNDLSGYQCAQQRGQVDSYLLFLSLAMQVVRPGGWIGLVIPDPVLARSNAARERRSLLAETTLHHLWHLAGVFPAYVGAVVIIAQKRPPSPVHQVAWLRETWPRLHKDTYKCNTHLEKTKGILESQYHSISQSLLRNQPGAELRYLLSDMQASLVGRLHEYLCAPEATQERRFVPLEELVLIRRGEELAKNSTLLLQKKPNDEQEWLPVLRGGIDLQSYAIPKAEHWIAREKVMKPLERYLMPKILVVKSTGHLQATLDLQGHVVLQTLYLLCSRSGDIDDLYFLQALLNSRLFQQYLSVLYTAYKWVQPQIEQHVLAHLPIPTRKSPQRTSISLRARTLMYACSGSMSVVELSNHYKLVYEEQERAICKLYEELLQEY